MKIWIDFINSPQVSFFEPLINELSLRGHEIILTCRNSANTVDLIRQRNWNYIIIGNNVKKATISKLFSFPVRVYALVSFLRKKGIDVAISQSSFYLPIAARILGIPSIYTNDNEHAMGNIPSFFFATTIFIPENLSLSKILKKGARRSKVFKYPGIKEGVYLWPKGIDIQNRRNLNGNTQRKIYVRPEPSTAQYYSGRTNFLDNLLIDLKKKYSITILTREKSQQTHYRQNKFSEIEVPERPLPFDEVAENCLLFIGAGGSMTREMALIGVPTISVYQGDLLEVDKFLIAQGLMIHNQDLRYNDVEQTISTNASRSVNMNLIIKGEEAYQLFKQEILKYNS